MPWLLSTIDRTDLLRVTKKYGASVKPRMGRKSVTTVNLETDQLESLGKIAQDSKRSVSYLVREAVSLYLSKLGGR